jgi:hypothetical protein
MPVTPTTSDSPYSKLLPAVGGRLRLMRLVVTVLLVAGVLVGATAWALLPTKAYSVVVSWDPTPDSGVVAYRVYYGRSSREYLAPIEVGSVTKARVPGLTGGVKYFFAVTAVHWNGEESEYSEEITFIPGPRLIRLAQVSDGSLMLTIHGVPGQWLNLEATADFKSWDVIATVQIEPNGCVEFVDPDIAGHPERYYRTRLVE